jgi:hypothetical protein
MLQRYFATNAVHTPFQVKQELQRLQEEYDACFGEPWGPLFKAGLFDSRFGKQVRLLTDVFNSFELVVTTFGYWHRCRATPVYTRAKLATSCTHLLPGMATRRQWN